MINGLRTNPRPWREFLDFWIAAYPMCGHKRFGQSPATFCVGCTLTARTALRGLAGCYTRLIPGLSQRCASNLWRDWPDPEEVA
jgi:hypothetical protein